jgi:diadenosine tetraphosphate (Ap4A) HIT family hydrolase
VSASDSRGAPGCGICAVIGRIEAGTFPDLVAELPTSYMILGDAQFYRGYCLMLAKRHVTEMFRMESGEARALFEEMRAASGAIAAIVNPWKLNYECLGNAEPHVHWHLIPRFESDALRRAPIWVRPESERKVTLPEPERRALIAGLRSQLKVRFPDARIPKA